MILNKSNLEVLRVNQSDKNQQGLNLLHVAKDGSTVAANSRSMVIVSPVKEELKTSIPLEESKGEGGNLAPLHVKEILKGIPNDTKFKGLLEHCDVNFNLSGHKTVATTTDGKIAKSLSFSKVKQPFINFKQMLKRVVKGKPKAKVIVNRRRLLDLLNAMEKIAPDRSKETPVYIEVRDNGLVLKCDNRSTKQRIFSVITSYQGEFVEEIPWEQGLRQKKRRRR